MMKQRTKTFHTIRFTGLFAIVLLGLVSIIGSGGGGGGGGKKTFTNSLGMSFKLIRSGTFIMGTSPDQCRVCSDEETQHQVTLTQDFYMQTTEVTQGQWWAVMGNNPSRFLFCGDNCPVEQVSWDDAQNFIATLNARGEGLYRLPTEAEWEYSCRAGSTTAFSNGDMTFYNDMFNDCNEDASLSVMGWYCYNSGVNYAGCDDLTGDYENGNSCAGTNPVAKKKANAWGLFDMHGNVREWCQDVFAAYPPGSAVDPTGPSSGGGVFEAVTRSGDWLQPALQCRSANRQPVFSNKKSSAVGFRVVCIQTGEASNGVKSLTAYYRDTDGDGYGDPNVQLQNDFQPQGYVINKTDCDDTDWSVNPGAGEVCGDGVDNDCNGQTDEGCDSSTFNNFLDMTFKLIPAGTFTMGSPTTEPGRDDDETQHQVTLTRSFYLQTTEVTQSQWQVVMGGNPSFFSACGSTCPVEQVSWYDAQDFIAALNAREEGTYRLPTEAEWEYACRGGSTAAFPNGPITQLDDMWVCNYDANLNVMGWYCSSSEDTTHPVAQKQANAWGLYDMQGNVGEWCQDRYGSYDSGSVVDPVGPSLGVTYVERGGGWFSNARKCRSADRGTSYADYGSYNVGFRLVYFPAGQ